MFTIPNLPTDNFYKFRALGAISLAITFMLSGMYIWYLKIENQKALNKEQKKLYSDMEVLYAKIAIQKKKPELKEMEKLHYDLFCKKTEYYHSIEIDPFEEIASGTTQMVFIICWVCMVFISRKAFREWREIGQKPIDRKLELENEKLSVEIEKLKKDKTLPRFTYRKR